MDTSTGKEIDTGKGKDSEKTGVKGWDTSRFNIIDKLWHWINRDILQTVVDITIDFTNKEGKTEKKTYTVGKNSLDGYLNRNQELLRIGPGALLTVALKAIVTKKFSDTADGWKARFDQFGLKIDDAFLTQANGFSGPKDGFSYIGNPEAFVAAVLKKCRDAGKHTEILKKFEEKTEVAQGKKAGELMKALREAFDEETRKTALPTTVPLAENQRAQKEESAKRYRQQRNTTPRS